MKALKAVKAPGGSPAAPWPDPAGMTAKELAGQMVAAGFSGTEPSPGILELIVRRGLGGVIYFSRNIAGAAQLRGLSARLQEAATHGSPSGLPLLISIDQEGGTVARLTEAEGGTVFPGNMLLGATGSADLAYAAARATATELRAVGVNWNFAPVVDVLNNPANPVISVRSYGEDPALVARLGAAAARGYQDGGVLATAKHFPGHGDTDKDSHLLLPTIPHPRERLDQVELVPFRAVIAAGVGAIMTAHITFPAIEDRPGRPATLSRAVLTGLLRKELAFQGLIVTDCMEMQAITKHFGAAAAAVEAVKAGADMVLVSHTFERQVASLDAIAAAITNGEIPRWRAEEAVDHILSAKARFASGTEGRGGAAGGPGSAGGAGVDPLVTVGSPEHRRLAAEIAAQGVTLLANDGSLIPAGDRFYRPLVVACRPAAVSPVESRHGFSTPLLEEVRRFRPEATGITIALDPTPEERAPVVAKAASPGTDLVIFASTEMRAHPAQAALAASLAHSGRPLVVVATRSPFDALALAHAPGPDGGTAAGGTAAGGTTAGGTAAGGSIQAGAFLAAYEYRLAAMRAATEIIFGARRPAGRLPVTLPGLYPVGHGVTN